MEITYVITLISAALCLGILIGHSFGKLDSKYQFEMGKLEGINELWPYVYCNWNRQASPPTGGTTGSSADRTKSPVQ